jgi:hypothetical protein
MAQIDMIGLDTSNCQNSHPGLSAITRLTLMLRLLLLFLLPGPVAAVEAAGGSSQPAVVAGIVTGDTADCCALQAALGLGGSSRERERGDGEQGDK